MPDRLIGILRDYAQLSAPGSAVTRASRPALRITRRCS
jgi:hypothetical protein